jgi:hypothetical protein
MYDRYTEYIRSIIDLNVEDWQFKSNPYYCEVLEHVSLEDGEKYLVHIG